MAKIHKTQSWIGELPGKLRMIDQTRLPEKFVEIDCETVQQVWDAIKRLSVRGAPAIGVSAAYGTVIGLQGEMGLSRDDFNRKLTAVTDHLASRGETLAHDLAAAETLVAIRLQAFYFKE